MSDAADHAFMARALRLAARGLYTSDPNPRVGCVLVRDGSVVGEGWHKRCGGPHAERVALAAAGPAARGATAYVTLEPCCHHGKTPPCTDALIANGVARVVVAMVDPNPLVAGQGLALLGAAGVAVESGVMETPAKALNPGFVKRMAQGLPYVRCKLAASLDGRTAMPNGESRWISSEEARRDVQFLRARSSAILTGVGTLLADDPSLNVRLDPGDLPWLEPGAAARQPLRVVVDSGLRTPARARILSLPGANLIACVDSPVERAAALESAGAGVLVCPDDGGRVDIKSLLRHLASLEMNELLIEAGPTLAGAFVAAGLVDELILYLAPHLMGDAARGLFCLPAVRAMAERIPLRLTDVRAIGSDWRLTARLAGS